MKSFKLETDQATLRYHDIPGDGTPLVFIHGLGSASSLEYPSIAGDPALGGRRMLLIDLLGSGFSDRPVEFGYTVADHARTVVALVDHLALAALDLFGHSMGGAIAITAACQLSERVRHLVVAEPNLRPGGGLASRGIAAMSEADFLAHGHAELVRSAQAEGYGGAWAESAAISAPYAIHRVAMSLVAGTDPTWRAQLCALKMPRTMIFGAASLPNDDAESLPRRHSGRDRGGRRPRHGAGKSRRARRGGGARRRVTAAGPNGGSMIFSDLPSPAEAVVHPARPYRGLRAGGKPLHTFGIMLSAARICSERCSSARPA
jgi:pimeloyl-ACP methyl ester carboxylesterase